MKTRQPALDRIAEALDELVQCSREQLASNRRSNAATDELVTIQIAQLREALANQAEGIRQSAEQHTARMEEHRGVIAQQQSQIEANHLMITQMRAHMSACSICGPNLHDILHACQEVQ